MTIGTGQHPVPIPGAREMFLDPLAQIVAGQRFAYELAVAKGRIRTRRAGCQGHH